MEDFSVKTIMPAIIGISLLLVGIMFPHIGLASVQAEYKEVSAKCAELENKYENDKSSQTAANKLQSTKYDAINELEVRHESDDVALESFMNKVLGWNSYETYMSVKTTIYNTYEPDTAFMNMFFPNVETTTVQETEEPATEVEQGSETTEESVESADTMVTEESDTIETEENSEEIAEQTDITANITGNKIDENNITMEFGGAQSYLLSSVGNDYTYIARVAVISHVGDSSSTSVMTIIYTVDNNGILSNIQGIL